MQDNSGYDIPSPQDAENQQNEQLAQMARFSPQQAGFQYGSNAMAGNPAIQHAKKVQDTFKNILSGSEDNAPEDESPLDKGMRISNALARGMASIDPNIAMRANQQYIKYSQAKSQQALIDAEAEGKQLSNKQDKQAASMDRVVLAAPPKQNPDGTVEMSDPVALLDPNSPTYNEDLAKAAADAAAKGVTVMPLPAEKWYNGKTMVAAMNNNVRLQVAQKQASERWQAAMLKSQQTGEGNMPSNMALPLMRMMNGLSEGTAALSNLAELPVGASSPWLANVGMGHSGTTVSGATAGNIGWGLSSNDQRTYQEAIVGLARTLATVEAAGAAQGLATFSDKVEASIKNRPLDTVGDGIQRLAESRQILENGMRAWLANPKLASAQRDEIEFQLDKLKTIIPYTVHDVLEFRKHSGQLKGQTFGDFVKSRGIGGGQQNTAPPAAAPPAAAPPAAAPQAALEHLRAHPEDKDQFKAKYKYLPE